MAEQKQEGMVQVKATELAAIIELNRKLLEQNGAPAEKPREIKDRKVTVFFIDNEPVIGYMNRGTENKPIYIYDKPNPNRIGEYLPMINVLTRNKKEPYVLNYNEFMTESDRKDCKILKTEEIPWTINQGRVSGRSFEEGTYNMLETGTIVPVEAKGIIRIFTVELPDGSQCDIHERYCNINK